MIDLPDTPISLEKQRIKICTACLEKQDEPIPLCKVCDKPLSLLTSDKEQSCPLNKW